MSAAAPPTISKNGTRLYGALRMRVVFRHAEAPGAEFSATVNSTAPSTAEGHAPLPSSSVSDGQTQSCCPVPAAEQSVAFPLPPPQHGTEQLGVAKPSTHVQVVRGSSV